MYKIKIEHTVLSLDSRTSLVAQLVKNSPEMRRFWFNSWVGKIPGKGKGYPLHYCGLENSMNGIVYGITKSWMWLSHSRCKFCVFFLFILIVFSSKYYIHKNIIFLQNRIFIKIFLPSLHTNWVLSKIWSRILSYNNYNTILIIRTYVFRMCD